jgi:hypothetical protein
MAMAGTMFNWSRSASKKTRSHAWIQGSYLLAAASSALGHLYTVGRVLMSADPETNFWRMYIPFPGFFSGPSGASDILVRGPWLFLQYDLIIISLSSLSWAYCLLLHHVEMSKVRLALAMLLGALTVGPGATVSLSLFVRQSSLLQNTKA